MLQRYDAGLVDLKDGGELEKMIVKLLDVAPLNVGVEECDKKHPSDRECRTDAKDRTQQKAKAQ
jgi:hypothetical protein